MKIRTITIGANIRFQNPDRQMTEISKFLHTAKKCYQDQGIEVQSLRLTTQSWTGLEKNYSTRALLNAIRDLESKCRQLDIDFVSVGQSCSPRSIMKIPDIIMGTQNTTACAIIGDRKNGLDLESVNAAAIAILKIARNTPGGYGNFRFACIINCPAGIPFYPASYHQGKPWFALGLECSDLISRAFKKGRYNIRKSLKKNYLSATVKLLKQSHWLESKYNIAFKGIDVSPAPSLSKQDSLAYAFERLGIGIFGASGTIAVAGMITDVLHSLPIRKCGYSGLMLPVLEDHGLARRYGSGQIKLADLLTISSVCGTGLDCIPLPGSIKKQQLVAILSDVATLSLKLNKPLSARLLPVPGKKAGERTQFNSPYLIDCVIPFENG